MINYPVSRYVDKEKICHGQTIADPHGWMDDVTSEEVRSWLKAQDDLTTARIDRTASGHRQDAIQFLSKFPPYIPPFRVDAGVSAALMPLRRGGRRFNINVHPELELAVFIEDSSGDKTLLHTVDGLPTLTYFPSPCGRFLAYIAAGTGNIHIHDNETGEHLKDCLTNIAATHLSWRPDSTGFFYNSAQQLKLSSMEDDPAGIRYGVFFHQMGDNEGVDKKIVDDCTEDTLSPLPLIMGDGQYLAIGVHDFWSSQIRSFSIRPLDADDGFVTLIPLGENYFTPLGNIGDEFYFVTNDNAEQGRIIAIRPDAPQRENWREVVPEQSDFIPLFHPDLLMRQHVVLAKTSILINYTCQTHSVVRVFGLDGSDLGEVSLPDMCEVTGLEPPCLFSDAPDYGNINIALESYLLPPACLVCNPEDRDVRWLDDIDPYGQLDSEIVDILRDSDTIEVFYPSKDGTQIPLTLVSRKGMQQDGTNPLLMYFYGGFNNTFLPGFAGEVALWLKHGGIYVHAHIRGGGEYGPKWHRAASPDRQISFDDVAAASDFLVAQGYTDQDRLFYKGESNGGLSVAACYAQHPEKFAGMICTMPAIDMISSLQDQNFFTWIKEFGDAINDRDSFERIMRYSPTHNLSPDVKYPPALVVIGDLDMVVRTGDVYKFVAQLQHSNDPDRVALLRIVWDHAHQQWWGEAGCNTAADMFAFLWRIVHQADGKL